MFRLSFGFCLSAITATAFAQMDLVPTTVQVPSPMAYAPFNVERTLLAPPGFTVSVFARLDAPRFMAVAPNGDVFVSQTFSGKVKVFRPSLTGIPQEFDYATRLRLPHDLVFRTIGQTTYLYVAESNKISRYTYTEGDTAGTNREIVIPNLPDASSPELGGIYGHQLKNIAIDSNDKLYVSIASVSNADPADYFADPIRCAVYRYNADGTGRELWAVGIRNGEGLAFLPGTNDLWVAVNQRDNTPYPHNDGTGKYGKVIPDYVDNHPPDQLLLVQKGMNYGWPFANPSPDSLNRMSNMPLDPDYNNNDQWRRFGQSRFARTTKGLQAHSAALGLTFTQGTQAPLPYRDGALIAFHGSWNRQRKTGAKVVYFPWNRATQTPLAQSDFVKGWIDEAAQRYWGRPVDAVVAPDGAIFISDDHSGTIYRLTYSATSQPGFIRSTIAIPTPSVNLSEEGAIDWVAWPSGIRKFTGGDRIEGYEMVGLTNIGMYTGSRTVSWTDGTSDAGSTRSGVTTSRLRCGFVVSAPADLTTRVLRLHLGTNLGRGRLTARLSDGSAPEFVTSIESPGALERVIAIRYRAGMGSQRLVVRWTASTDTARVRLQAATLAFR
jgi:glucose/arabinose dehydrogenase